MQADILLTISSDLAAYILQSTRMNLDFSFYSISIISALSQPQCLLVLLQDAL